MAVIAGYTTLQTAVADYLARSDLTSFLPNFIQNWEERFYRQSDNWGSWMESALNVTITNSLGPVPADYLGLKTAYISGQSGPPLKRISLEQLYSRYPRVSSNGTPRYISRDGANFVFGPSTSSGTLVGTYYAKPTVMRNYTTGGADAAAHFLIVNAPDLCLYGSLLEAEPFIKNDQRLPVWGQLYDAAVSSYRARMNWEEFSGGAPHTVAG